MMQDIGVYLIKPFGVPLYPPPNPDKPITIPKPVYLKPIHYIGRGDDSKLCDMVVFVPPERYPPYEDWEIKLMKKAVEGFGYRFAPFPQIF